MFGVKGAEAASLTFMAGSSNAAQAAAALLASMTGRLVSCGGPGAGGAAKICNNMLRRG